MNFDPKYGDLRGGLVGLIGAELGEVNGDGATITIPVSAGLLQPQGIVHGGVYCTIVETLGSLAGAMWLGERGNVVGVANHTNFLRAARSGHLHGAATPLHRGRSQQLWLVVITDDDDQVLARGEVRLANIASTDHLATK